MESGSLLKMVFVSLQNVLDIQSSIVKLLRRRLVIDTWFLIKNNNRSNIENEGNEMSSFFISLFGIYCFAIPWAQSQRVS